MKTIVLAVLALAVAALVLAFSTAEAAMRRVPDLTAITSAPVVAVATEKTVKRRVAETDNTDTAD